MMIDDTQTIRWRLHLNASRIAVYELLATAEGRAQFWAESALEAEGEIEFIFPSGITWTGRVLAQEPPTRFAVEYFGGSTVTFALADDGEGGTDLTLTDQNVPAEWRHETHAGWASVLMALKAAADFGVDLRNHDPERTWDEGYVDN